MPLKNNQVEKSRAYIVITQHSKYYTRHTYPSTSDLFFSKTSLYHHLTNYIFTYLFIYYVSLYENYHLHEGRISILFIGL